GADKILWAIETCLLRGNTLPPSQISDLVLALYELKPGQKNPHFSDDDAALLLTTALANQFRRLPQSEKDPQCEKWQELQLLILQVLRQHKSLKALPVLEVIADCADYPLPKVRAEAKALIAEMCDRTGDLRDAYKVRPGAAKGDLAKTLSSALTNS